MTRTWLALCLGLALTAAPAQADSVSWEPAKQVNSVFLARFVDKLHNTGNSRRVQQWGLVSRSTLTLPEGQHVFITFWRLYRNVELGSDAIYRCVDVFDSAMRCLSAVCYTPESRR